MNEYKNLLEAQGRRKEINNKRTLGGADNERFELELKIIQHYFAFSKCDIPFKQWVKSYLEDILISDERKE